MTTFFPFERVVPDTMILIYLFEDVAPYAAQCEKVFEAIRLGEISGVITPITLAEIMVKPLNSGRRDIAELYRRSLATFPNLESCVIDHAIGAMAGALRSKYRLPLPDLFQVACAMAYKSALLTNDKALKSVAEVPVFILEDLTWL